MISVHLSCTAENFKAMLQYIWDLELAEYNTLQPFEETRQKLNNSNSLPDLEKLAWDSLAQPAINLAKFIQLTT